MHITKKSLFRKLSIISLAVLVFVSSLLGTTASTANAVGVDTVVKLAGGKAVVRALAEKAGIALSKKQLDDVTGYIQKKSYDGDQKAIDFSTNANALTGTPSKTGFQKYVVDPFNWLTGLDLIFEAIQVFAMFYDNGEQVEVYGNVPACGFYLTNITTTSYDIHAPNGLSVTIQHTWNTYGWTVLGLNGVTIDSVDKSVATAHVSIKRNSDGFINTGNDPVKFSGPVINQCEGVQTVQPEPVNITNIDNSVVNNFDNDTYNTNTIYNIEIEMPDTPNYEDTTPWNEPDTNIPTEVDPKPVDTDEDGVPDETDSNADGDGFLENLIGIVALIAIFDLLKAVIFYLARMFEFILTIPLIEAIPIDNVAFEWFKTADIVGIQIYSVISLLATIGLSFAVYKVVRRLLP